MLNTCINGDCLQWMRGVNDPFADLIIADPPFNIGLKYDLYYDLRTSSDYLGWCKEWITECSRILRSDGNMLICIGDEHVSDIDCLCRSMGLIRNNWIIWHYKFGQSGKLDTRKKFTRSKTHVLRFIKNKKHFFDAASVAVPSDRQLAYKDKRADPRGKCPDDVFSFKRIAGTHIERVRGVPTQMPVQLLRIWIKSMCKPKGTVFDPFPGSGASLIAAKREGRDYLGVELSVDYTNKILDRLSKT